MIGRPAATIADLARRNAATAIVTGSRGRGGLRAAVLGSVSRELVGIAPCPVIVTDTSRTEGYGPVIAGIPDDHDDAAVVERHARQLAETLQRPLLLVEADGSGPPSGGATAAIEAAGDAVWRLAPPGRPAEALRRAAHNVDAALVVVGSRTGALGAFIGASTSAELGRTLRRPLAVIPLRALDDDDDRAA